MIHKCVRCGENTLFPIEDQRTGITKDYTTVTEHRRGSGTTRHGVCPAHTPVIQHHRQPPRIQRNTWTWMLRRIAGM